MKDIVERAMEMAQKMQEKIPPPRELTQIVADNPVSLSGLLRETGNMLAYLQYESAGLQLEVKIRQKKFELIAAPLKVAMGKPGAAERAKDDFAIATDENARAAWEEWSVLESVYKGLSLMVDSYESAYNTVSRQVTLKEIEATAMRGNS